MSVSLLKRFAWAFILLISGVFIVYLVNAAYNDYIQNKLNSTQTAEIILPELVLIPAGSFTMGEQESTFINSLREDEKKYFGLPNKTIEFTQSFYMTRHEITREQYTSYVQAKNLKHQIENISTNDLNHDRKQPAVEVNWRMAMSYATWLGEQKQLNCRLPTEAEWEYAAKSGQKTAYPWGHEIGTNNANCNNCGSQWDNLKAAPVGQFRANTFGLYDTSGNVWEWTCSKWQDQFNGQEQQCAPMTDFSTRVVRGGSWAYDAKYIRTSTRGEFDASVRYNGFGFRIMCAAFVNDNYN